MNHRRLGLAKSTDLPNLAKPWRGFLSYTCVTLTYFDAMDFSTGWCPFLSFLMSELPPSNVLSQYKVQDMSVPSPQKNLGYHSAYNGSFSQERASNGRDNFLKKNSFVFGKNQVNPPPFNDI